MVEVVLPVKQGLKLTIQSNNYKYYIVEVVLPVKQGLKPSISCSTNALCGSVEVVLPVKQGLKQSCGFYKSNAYVEVVLPVKQGLKHTKITTFNFFISRLKWYFQ